MLSCYSKLLKCSPLYGKKCKCNIRILLFVWMKIVLAIKFIPSYVQNQNCIWYPFYKLFTAAILLLNCSTCDLKLSVKTIQE